MNLEIDRLENIYNDLLLSSGVKVFNQKAKISGYNSVILHDNTKIKAKE